MTTTLPRPAPPKPTPAEKRIMRAEALRSLRLALGR